MDERTLRARMLLGGEAMEKIKNSHVAVFGLGGVGSWCAEALARSGVGKLSLVDRDTVGVSNINRQLAATHSTVGMLKTEAAKRRISEINPDCEVNTFNIFILPENIDKFDFTPYDYVVDAIDTVSGKIAII